MPELENEKHEIFARELALGEGLEVSYLAAGYRPSPSARFNVSRLKAQPHVKKRIDELMAELAIQAAPQIEFLQGQLLPLLQANVRDLFDSANRLRLISDLPRELTAAIKSVKFDRQTGNVTEIVMADKVSVATVLLRSIGALAEASFNVGIDIHTQLGVRLDAAIARSGVRNNVVNVTPEAPRINKADLPMEL
jgi:phage terminase small subunit